VKNTARHLALLSAQPRLSLVPLTGETLDSLRRLIELLQSGTLDAAAQARLAQLIGERAHLLLAEVDHCHALLTQCTHCGGQGECRACRGWSEVERHLKALGRMYGCQACGDTKRCRACKGSGKRGE
jgi:primosomal protein N'